MYYKGQFAEAESAFGAIAERDPAAHHYQQRCQALAHDPPPDWDGVWSMHEK